MGQKIIHCPACGQEILVEEERMSCFCPQCGNKIVLQKPEEKKKEVAIKQISNEEDKKYVEKKLEEAEFYIQLSHEKAEAQKYNQEPVYYVKAQDLLLDLAEQYPNDYRVWWELCKPIDFESPLAGAEAYQQYSIQETYFNNALDLAELPDKRRLIEEYDRYVSVKKQAQLAFENKQREAEERQRVIEEERREAEEKNEQIRRKAEEERYQKGIEESQEMWGNLYNKNYQDIDQSLFSFVIGNNQTIICVFKEVSKIMYLNVFRKDGNKNNVISREQAIAVQFDQRGYCLKYDRTPIKIKGWQYPNNLLWVVRDGAGGIRVNNMKLIPDKEYTAFILKTAKKPILSGMKIMI